LHHGGGVAINAHGGNLYNGGMWGAALCRWKYCKIVN